MYKEFQSTLPRRERLDLNANGEGGFEFQSTLPRRERPVKIATMTFDDVFQSTLPRRERLILPLLKSASQNFNPRSREGSDRYFY